MSDDLPRPQYGEYATPEQQAAAMGKPWPPPPEPETLPATAEPANYRPTYVTRQPGYANRFFTVFLLGFGALMLFGDIPIYTNFASALKGAYASSGYTVTVPASLGAAGIPILIANVVIYAVTVVFSVLAMRRGRASFYIPVVGFIVFVIAASVITVIVSPAFAAQFSK